MSEKISADQKLDGRRLLACLFALVVAAILVSVLVFTIIRPSKPVFTLEDATVFRLNLSAAPNAISAAVQVTVSARNPNGNTGVYYDSLHAYADYRSQQVTYFAAIPPAYQVPRGVDVWSPLVYGDSIPVAPYNGLALAQDAAGGSIPLDIRINGRIRWRLGPIITGRVHLHVDCPAVIPVGRGVMVGVAVKYQLSQSCSVSV
ncbi:late embryogenesis abundant protein [Striga asiatica]|uniref:Late embryogenesis abundant protein n=1 Tax=Striga asiatica TaxID=4170 RepID=A0A5A7QG20_STRAF|nr:late embryogenesis abundant protein [Striga asiatica]